MRTVLLFLLAIIIVVLGYMVYRSIQTPIEYEKIKKQRGKLVVEKLKLIRTAERAYKSTYGKYAKNLDSLVYFIENDHINVIKAEGSLTDEMLEQGITEAEAVKKGLIKRDTLKVPVKEARFKGVELDLPNLKYIPGTKVEFEVSDNEIELTAAAHLKIHVVEIRAPLLAVMSDKVEEYLESFRTDLAEYERLNKYAGWKIGSLEESNDLAGTWE